MSDETYAMDTLQETDGTRTEDGDNNVNISSSNVNSQTLKNSSTNVVNVTQEHQTPTSVIDVTQAHQTADNTNYGHDDDEDTTTTNKTQATTRNTTTLKSFLSENALILSTIAGIAVGFSVGIGLQSTAPSKNVLTWIGFPGELFLRALRSTIVPIVVCMVITATSTVDPRSNGRMAGIAVLGFFLTAVLAVITSVLLFLAFKPDANTLSESETADSFGTKLDTQDVFLDLMRNILPDNIVGATVSQAVTEYVPKTAATDNGTDNNPVTVAGISYKKTLAYTRGVNILGLITVCATIGAAAQKTLTCDSAFLTFFRQGQEVILVIMHWLAWTTPVGVASLVAESVAGVDSLSSVFVTIGRLVICVILGLAIHQLIVLPAAFLIIVRENPFVALVRCAKSFFVAFAATSTSVAMPQMLDACRAIGVKEHVSRFVIPMSVTLHADGSALYMASAAMFVAQTSSEGGVAIVTVVIIGCLASVLSLAIPPVPSSSIVNIVIILTAIDYPLHGIALLFTVEWLLDRLRSGVNATSHVFVAAFTSAIDKRRALE